MSGRTYSNLKSLIAVNLTRTECIDNFFLGYSKVKNSIQEVDFKCGLTEINFGCSDTLKARGTVLNGLEARISQWPFLVALISIKKNFENSFFCGGSLLTSRHVLTGR